MFKSNMKIFKVKFKFKIYLLSTIRHFLLSLVKDITNKVYTLVADKATSLGAWCISPFLVCYLKNGFLHTI